MRLTKLFSYSVAAAFAVGVSGFAMQSAWADDPHTETFTAALTILDHLGITQTLALNLGKVVSPTDNTTTFLFTPTGAGSPATPVGGDGAYAGGQVNGKYKVTGTNGSYTFTAGTNLPVLCFAGVNLIALSNSPAGTIAGGFETIVLGAKWTVDVAASGSGTCSFDLEAKY